MLTIDEAIKHCEEVAEQNEWFDKNCLESMQCRECAKEHRQLAEWLKELKQLREQTRWIPVSEGLPNLDDYTGSKTWQKEVLITGYLTFDGPKDLFVSEVFAEDVTYNRVPDTIVLAWMPKPEPYKAERSSEDENTV